MYSYHPYEIIFLLLLVIGITQGRLEKKPMNYQKMYETSIKDGSAKQMVSEIKTEWEEGETIIGELLDITQVHFEETGNDVNGYLFKTDAGLIQFTMGAAVDIQAGNKFMIGMVYACTFKGKKDIGKGRNMNVWQVLQIGKGETWAKQEQKEN